jgi:hypothetical protein
MGWEEIAIEQAGMICRAQATNSGLTAKQIERLVISGTWDRVHPSVYRQTSAPQVWPASLQAALLWAGPGAVVSHESAAALWGIRKMSKSVVQISGTRALRAPRGIQYTRVLHLDLPDIADFNGILVTSPPRTMLDLSGTLSELRFERALDDLLLSPVTCRLEELEWVLERNKTQGRKGVAFMRDLVANRKRYGLLESPLESDFEAFRRRNGLPEAEHQWVVLGKDERWVAKVDFAWPEKLVAVQTNGKVHMEERTWKKDQHKNNDFQGTPWKVYSVTSEMLNKTPKQVLQMLRGALARPTPPTSAVPARSP